MNDPCTMKKMPTKTSVVDHQKSWVMANDRVSLALTQTGGHLGPVAFKMTKGTLTPFSVAPWHGENRKEIPALLNILRGDFFCMPFGGNDEAYRKEKHPIHGETANKAWTLVGHQGCDHSEELTAVLKTKTRPGKVTKTIRLVEGQRAIYQKHTLEGYAGPMPLGHHAMLRFDESGLLSTSDLAWGQVFPGPFENPALGGYQALIPGARFDRLDRVPAMGGGVADLGTYPARDGFEDLVMLPAASGVTLGWTAVVFPKSKWMYLALRRTDSLRSTVLWMSNGGRHYAPWEGRHRRIMGIEDVTAHFHSGIAGSVAARGKLPDGIPTALELKKDKPTTIPYVMAIAEVPPGFDRVKQVHPQTNLLQSGVNIVDAKGKKIFLELDMAFLGL